MKSPGARGVRKSRIVIAAVAATIIAGGLYYALTSGGRSGLPTNGVGAGVALIGGPFTLVDQSGTQRSDLDFRGKLMLIYFGYTHCPDACPTALQSMTDAIDTLGERGAGVESIFITVDPARDTPAHLKRYLESFHPRMVALTGDESAIVGVAKAYRIFYTKAKDQHAAAGTAQSSNKDYLIDHSSFIYLMGRDGRYLTHFPGNASPEQLAEGIRKFL
jgi:cytochrome oxidase Cu insertion factor (SCO1/SenC/PrrC family)